MNQDRPVKGAVGPGGPLYGGTASPETAASSTTPSQGAGLALHPWWAFGPLALVVGLRWVLDWLNERRPQPPAWALAPFAGAEPPYAWLQATGWVLAGLAAAAVGLAVLRRLRGARAAWRLAALLWLLLCLAGCAGQLLQFMNLRALAPQAEPLAGTVLGSRAIAPSLRSTGGALVVLQIAGEPPRQMLVNYAAADPWPAGLRLALAWSKGRFWGRYVTGWQAAGPQAPLPPLPPDAGKQ